MKWLFPIAMAAIAAYMWDIDKGNSSSAFTVSIISAIVCFILEFREQQYK